MTGKGWKGLSNGNKVLMFFMGLFVLSIIFVSLIVMSWMSVSGIDAVHDNIETAKPYLALLRLFLFCVLFGLWPFWIHGLTGWKNLNETQIRLALSVRWRVALWFLIIELVMVQELIRDFVGQFIWDGVVTL